MSVYFLVVSYQLLIYMGIMYESFVDLAINPVTLILLRISQFMILCENIENFQHLAYQRYTNRTIQ